MPRWICPTCSRGKLAPSKPRKNDSRLYCFPCSEKTGRLVRRTCPALESKRESRAGKKKEKTKKQRARVRAIEAALYEVQGIDIRDELHRIWGMARTRLWPGMRALPPDMNLRRSRTHDDASGHAYGCGDGQGRIALTIGRNCNRARAVYVLAHELAHVLAPRREHHGQKFHAVLGELLEMAYGVRMAPAYRATKRARSSMFVESIKQTEWYRETEPKTEGENANETRSADLQTVDEMA